MFETWEIVLNGVSFGMLKFGQEKVVMYDVTAGTKSRSFYEPSTVDSILTFRVMRLLS